MLSQELVCGLIGLFRGGKKGSCCVIRLIGLGTLEIGGDWGHILTVRFIVCGKRLCTHASARVSRTYERTDTEAHTRTHTKARSSV